MELWLLMWRFFALILLTDGMTEFCAQDPPTISDATFKALMYKTGTLLNCECKRGFRRLDKGFMNCTESSGHASWENQCQCRGTSSREREKQVTPKPEEQKERNTTDVQSQVRPTGPANPPGHCKEPPPWEHEALKRIYHFVVGQTLHYECAQGFRALQRGPAVSTCKSICGKARWTRPQLKCTKERTDRQGPGDEEPQAGTDTPAGRETSCPLMMTDTTTADFQKHTAVATTTETVMFTTEYQMAVAICVLLLIGILLLSGLTWQQRWRKSRRTL